MPIKNRTLGQESDVAAALAYPFAIPKNAFLLTAEGVEPLEMDSGQLAEGPRVPVLAVGSNQSPDRLAHKYDGRLEDETVPVSKGWLRDFDVVYSAHFSSYGSIPATLAECPGVQVSLSVTWLSPRQLQWMHETEAVGLNYGFGALQGLTMTMDDGFILSQAYTYATRRGLFMQEGHIVSVAEIDAKGRGNTAMTQEAAQKAARQILAPELTMQAFVSGNIYDVKLRGQRNESLGRMAKPFACERYREVEA
jgi:hypothetical protein